MKAISLWQPFATAMALGLKANETRSWNTDYRGDLVICSAKSKHPEFNPICRRNGIDPDSIPYGCALCVVELFHCVSASAIVVNHAERELGDYQPWRFVWLTRRLRVIATPIPVIGRQGFFNVDIDPRIL